MKYRKGFKRFDLPLMCLMAINPRLVFKGYYNYHHHHHHHHEKVKNKSVSIIFISLFLSHFFEIE